MAEPQVVAEEVRDARLEAVELGQRVFPDREEEARAEARAFDRFRKLREERARPGLALVIEEVLLDAVEDHVDVTV